MFFKGLLEEAGISGDEEEMLVNLIQEKNYFGVEELLNSLNIDKHISDVLLELPQMFGSVEVLDKAAQLTRNADCLAAIDRLLKLYELLKVTGNDRYISFDMGALSSHAYYTGIIFRAYTFGTGEPVVNGGRYDKLIGQFGCDKASIGFSITVDSLMAAINRQKLEIPVDTSGVLFVYEHTELIRTIAIADQLRKMNRNVCMVADNSQKDEKHYAEYALNAQLEYVVFLNKLKTVGDEFVEVLSVHTMDRTQVSLDDIVGGKLS
jgi:ATP phosphoribosyltransferase regulatory subunit